MHREIHRELFDQERHRLLVHLLGSSHWRPVLFTVLVLTSLGWFADSLFVLADGWLRHGWLGQASPALGPSLVLALPFPLLVLWLLLLARRARSRLNFRVHRQERPWDVEGLVLFLSPLDEEKSSQVRALVEGPAGSLESKEDRGRVEGPWRMPLEALAGHTFDGGSHLKEVVIVDSSGEKGSHAQLDGFRALLDHLWPGREGDRYPGLGGPVRVRVLSTILDDRPEGVDVFDVESLVRDLDRLFHRLVEEGLHRNKVVFDITSGSKLASVAGASVALATGRRFQYVDTHDYRVHLYDPAYDLEGSDP